MINNYLGRLISVVNRKGKKSLATKIVMRSLLLIRSKKNLSVNNILEKVLFNCQPKIFLKSKKIAGSVYKIPKPYTNLNNFSVGTRWLVEGARNNHERGGMTRKISTEVLDSLSNKGLPIKRKKELHRLGVSNRPNLKYM